MPHFVLVTILSSLEFDDVRVSVEVVAMVGASEGVSLGVIVYVGVNVFVAVIVRVEVEITGRGVADACNTSKLLIELELFEK